jgi:lipid A 3-O-deacylase
MPMSHHYLKSIIAFLLGAACTSSGAQTLSGLMADYQKVSAEGRTVHLLDIDNDSLLLNKNDGFYTSGLRYTKLHTLNTVAGATTYGWRIGQELYTASDIKLPPELVGPPNHPYAAWLFVGMFKENSHRDGTYTKWGIDVGCLGPCAGGESTQTAFHRVLNQPEPKGWSKQVKNEPGVILYGEIAPVRWTLGPSVDITPNLHGRFGNILTDAGVGVTVRAGQLNLLPNQSTLHGFVRMYANAVGYNATLQGGYFSNDNPHTVDPKRSVGAAEAGVAWSKGPYGFRASLVRHSNEIRALPNSIGSQNFVRLQFSYAPE